MKKYIATLLRRTAQWLDPQKPEVTGYARQTLGYVPYIGIEVFRKQLMTGDEEGARTIKHSMRVLAEATAETMMKDALMSSGTIRVEHNYGTKDKKVDGILCKASGATVILEVKGSWV